jgi:putative transcriptional regulator
VTSSPNHQAARTVLAAARVERGMTLDVLSGLAGIPRSVLTDIESGRSHGSITSWFALAQALELHIGELLDHLHDPTT